MISWLMEKYIKNMKHIKLFEQFINEMEIGKTLFSKSPTGMGMRNAEGDPPQWDWKYSRYHYKKPNREFTQKLKDSFKNVDELNTPEEHRLLDFLSKWIELGDSLHVWRKLPDTIYKDLKYLLKIKKKFPLILDPMQGSNNLNKFWRGASISLDKANEILDNAKLVKRGADPARFNSVNRYEIKTSVGSRALLKKNAASFTSNWNTANVFLNSRTRNPEDDRVPVILEVPANSPNLLFNPEFLNLFSDYEEDETFYVGDKEINITAIYLNPYAVDIKTKNE